MAVLAVTAGLLLGSFLNVCIGRLPVHQSIAWPGSRCPYCLRPIRPWDNIPLLSFVLLRGRCRDCREPISPRYPLIEAALAGLFLASAVRFPTLIGSLEASVFCFLLLGLFSMDAETLRLPDSFTLPGLALGLLQAALPTQSLSTRLDLARNAPFPVTRLAPFVSSLVAAAGAAGLLLLIGMLYRLIRKREGLGLGDVKLAAMLGAWLGGFGAGLTLVLGILLAAFGGVLLLAKDPKAGQLRIPFGSFLCAGALLVLFAGSKLLMWYFQFWP